MGKKQTKKKASRAALESKNRLYQYLQQQERKAAAGTGFEFGLTKATVVFLYCLHTMEKDAWGKKRLSRIMNQVFSFCNQFVSTDTPDGWMITIEDMVNCLKDECEINIDLKEGRIDFFGMPETKEHNDALFG